MQNYMQPAHKPAATSRRSSTAEHKNNKAQTQKVRSAISDSQLRVAETDDPAELEADRIADEVMTMDEHSISMADAGEAPLPPAQNQNNTIHRMCNACKASLSEDEPGNTCKACSDSNPGKNSEVEEQSETIQRKTKTPSTPAINHKLNQQIRAITSGGKPMTADTQNFFTPRFGADFSAVRIHTDSQAARTAEAINAKAYTLSNHIIFAENQYAPETREGKHLLAHELSHVLQQNPFISRTPGDDDCDTGHHDGGGAYRRGADYYYIWGTWREGDTEQGWGERTVDHWLSWRWGPGVVPSHARARVARAISTQDFSRLSEFELVPGCQFRLRLRIEIIRSITTYVESQIPRRRQESQEENSGNDDADVAASDNPDATAAELTEGDQPSPGDSDVGTPEGQVDGNAAEGEASTEPVPDQTPLPIINDSTYLGGQAQHSQVRELRQAFPAEIRGMDMQPPNGIGVYTMRLDYRIAGPDLLSQVAEAMNWVNYRWEIYNVTALMQRGFSAEEQRRREHAAASDSAEISDLELAGRRAEHRAGDVAEDAGTAFEGILNPIDSSYGNGAGEVVTNAIANRIQLQLLPVQALMSAGGFLVDTLADLFGGTEQEREIPWPTEEGHYMIRCIAQPSPQGENDDVLRLPSVASKIVRLVNPNELASDALDMPEARVAEIETLIEIERRKDPVDTRRIARLEAQIADIRTGATGDPADVIRIAIRNKEAEKARAPAHMRARIQRQIDRLQEHLQFIEQRAAEHPNSEETRIEAVLVSDITGQNYNLLLQLEQLSASEGAYRYQIIDVTSDRGETYPGGGTTANEAVMNAIRNFNGHHPYGRGSFSYRLPQNLGISPNHHTMRSAPENTDLARSRLEELATLLSMVALAVPGVGQAAAVLGAAVAAERLINRWSQGTLRFDVEAVTDVISILGAAAAGANAIGRAQVVRAGNTFTLAQQSGNVAQIERAARLLRFAQTGARVAEISGEIANWGGFLWGQAVTLGQIMDINAREMRGEIPHAQARRERARLITSALRDGLMQFMDPPEQRRRPSTDAPSTGGTAHPESAPHGDGDSAGRPRPVDETPASTGRELPTVSDVDSGARPPAADERTGPAADLDAPPPSTEGRTPTPEAESARQGSGDDAEAAAASRQPAHLPEGVTGNERVVGAATTPDGLHTISVTEDGRIIRCSRSCGELRNHYGEFLELPENHPQHEEAQRLRGELEALQQIAEEATSSDDKQYVAEEAARLEQSLRQHASEPLAREFGEGVSQHAVDRMLTVFSPAELRQLQGEIGNPSLERIGTGGDGLVRLFDQALERAAEQPDSDAARGQVLDAATSNDPVDVRSAQLRDMLRDFQNPDVHTDIPVTPGPDSPVRGARVDQGEAATPTPPPESGDSSPARDQESPSPTPDSDTTPAPAATPPTQDAPATQANQPHPRQAELDGLLAQRREAMDILREMEALREEYNRENDIRRRLWQEYNQPGRSREQQQENIAARRDAVQRRNAIEERRQALIEEHGSTAELSGVVRGLNGQIATLEVITNPDTHRAALPCFAKATPVQTPDGFIAIENIKSGDRVLVFDDEKQRVTSSTVLQNHCNRTKHFYHIKISGETIKATGQHPFYLPETSQWLVAKCLVAGMTLQFSHGGKNTIQSVDFIEVEDAETYNLSIARHHNYFVGELPDKQQQRAGILVHNTPETTIDLGMTGQYEIYIVHSPLPEFAGMVYVGQTMQGQGWRARFTGHHSDARRALARGNLSAEDQRFYRFMLSIVEPTTLITGIQNKDQADFLEQQNIEIERTLAAERRSQTDSSGEPLPGEVMNRRNQLTSTLEEVTERIVADPSVRAAGYCTN